MPDKNQQKQTPPIQSSQRGRSPVLTSRNISIVITGAVFIYAIYRADSKDIPKIVESLVGSNTFAVVGWILACVFLLGAIISIKLQSRIYEKELNRLAKERDELQRLLLNHK